MFHIVLYFFILKLITYLHFADVNVTANRYRLKRPYSTYGACDSRNSNMNEHVGYDCTDLQYNMYE